MSLPLLYAAINLQALLLQQLPEQEEPIVQDTPLTDKTCRRCGLTLPTLADR